MASNVLPKKPPIVAVEVGRPTLRREPSAIEKILRPLASLKLTVALFAMAIFIIWAGTLAQKDSGIWVAISQYFRTWFAFVEFKIFFFFQEKPPSWTAGFYFPGGRLIGVAMAVNLLAAHAVRFKMQAKDWRLPVGLLVVGAGIGLLALVVMVGNHLSGVQAGSFLEWSTLWFVLKLGMAAVVAGGIAGLVTINWSRHFERNMLLVGTTIAAALLAWLLYRSDFVPDPSSLRIVWQLIEGEAVGLTLLAGCMLLFNKRAGIVLIHAGIGLMMFNELFVDVTAKEPQQLQLREGQARNYTEDDRSCELAIVTSADRATDGIAVVPKSLLLSGELIHSDKLPFDLQVVKFFQNSAIDDVAPGDENLATAGQGLDSIAVNVKPVSGTDASGRVDAPAAYVKVLKSGTSKVIGTYLTGVLTQDADKIEVGGKTYELSLRFKRDYKPYAVRLIKTEEVDWPGTKDPRYFSSDIRLISTDRKDDRHEHIWMNNPLRFGGETFYQSGFTQIPDGDRYSTLSVVDNTGWMIPYIGCMIVATGLLSHFLSVLLRFVRRLSSGQQGAMLPGREMPVQAILVPERAYGSASNSSGSWMTTAAEFFPWVIVAVAAGLALSQAIVPSSRADAMHLYEFGQIPVIQDGRTKPIDTLARTTLWAISDRQSFMKKVDKEGKEVKDAKDGTSRPAIEWLLDVIADPQAADEHEVFKIDNFEVVAQLGLERRAGHRYSYSEILDHLDDLKKEVAKAEAVDDKQRSPYQEGVLDLARRVTTYIGLREAFDPAQFPVPPTADELKQDPQGTYDQTLKIVRFWDAPPKDNKMRLRPKPLLTPVASLDGEWHSYSSAVVLNDVATQALHQPADVATQSLEAMFKAYGKHKVADFNSELAAYRARLESAPPKLVDPGKLSFEMFFNHFDPFSNAFWLYLFAFVLSCCGLLGWTLGWGAPLNRAALGIIVFTLIMHTFALWARIYLSGRPPVTTLYSAAVFIGWAGVLLGIVLELVYRIGIGNLIAAAAGAIGLGIAALIFQFLDAGKDTIVVPEAVLDTQFWLGTHVVCVTLGYATTLVAGLLGFAYIILGICTPLLGYRLNLRTMSVEQDLPTMAGRGNAVGTMTFGKVLANMTYGAVCFAILFSFVGTVLGGLWADDSWGRFWGWDPKENGALIIVLWNALVLHALWDGMVKDRGLAVLVLGGNVVTMWSMFGVNFLGVGLHAYAFSSAGAWAVLGIVAACHLALVAVGCLPKSMWMSFRETA